MDRGGGREGDPSGRPGRGGRNRIGQPLLTRQVIAQPGGQVPDPADQLTGPLAEHPEHPVDVTLGE